MKSGISPFFRNSLAIPDIFYPCKMDEITFLFPKFFHFSCCGCGGSHLDSGSSVFSQKAGWRSQNFPAPHIRTDRKLSVFPVSFPGFLKTGKSDFVSHRLLQIFHQFILRFVPTVEILDSRRTVFRVLTSCSNRMMRSSISSFCMCVESRTTDV